MHGNTQALSYNEHCRKRISIYQLRPEIEAKILSKNQKNSGPFTIYAESNILLSHLSSNKETKTICTLRVNDNGAANKWISIKGLNKHLQGN